MKTLKNSILEAKFNVNEKPIKIRETSFEFKAANGKSYRSTKDMLNSNEETIGTYYIALNVEKSAKYSTNSNVNVSDSEISFDVKFVITITDDFKGEGNNMGVNNVTVKNHKAAYGLINRGDVLQIIDYCFNMIDTYPDIKNGDEIISDVLWGINEGTN